MGNFMGNSDYDKDFIMVILIEITVEIIIQLSRWSLVMSSIVN
jgi:hypothetical protein